MGDSSHHKSINSTSNNEENSIHSSQYANKSNSLMEDHNGHKPNGNLP